VSGTFFLTGQACFVKLAVWGDRIAPAEEPKKVPDTNGTVILLLARKLS
jgi:hypothetical protein